MGWYKHRWASCKRATVRVFTYGSNMCSGRLRDYGVHPLLAGEAAMLQGYCVVFNKLSKKDHSGKANLEISERECVWGVLYEIPGGDLKTLDQGEGKGYARCCLPVVTRGGRCLDAWVYLADAPDETGKLKPYTWYTRFIVEGAIEHQLPNDYVERLRSIAAEPDPDRTRDAAMRALSCGD